MRSMPVLMRKNSEALYCNVWTNFRSVPTSTDPPLDIFLTKKLKFSPLVSMSLKITGVYSANTMPIATSQVFQLNFGLVYSKKSIMMVGRMKKALKWICVVVVATAVAAKNHLFLFVSVADKLRRRA